MSVFRCPVCRSWVLATRRVFMAWDGKYPLREIFSIKSIIPSNNQQLKLNEAWPQLFNINLFNFLTLTTGYMWTICDNFGVHACYIFWDAVFRIVLCGMRTYIYLCVIWLHVGLLCEIINSFGLWEWVELFLCNSGSPFHFQTWSHNVLDRVHSFKVMSALPNGCYRRCLWSFLTSNHW